MQAPDHLFPIDQENRVLFRQFRTEHAVQHPFHRGELPFPFRRINNKASFAQRPEQMEPRISRNRLQAAAVLDGHGPGPFHQSGRPGHIIFHQNRMGGRTRCQHADAEDCRYQQTNACQTQMFFPAGGGSGLRFSRRRRSGRCQTGFAAQVSAKNTGKMPQQSYSDDVGGPFGHLLQGIMGSAENGDEPARMQGILAPAHLVQRPAGKAQRLVHADNGVILTAGFRENGYLGFIGFRLGSPRIKLRHKAVQAQIKRKGIFMHPVPLGQFHLFHGHRHFVAQHDTGQQQQNSPMSHQHARVPPGPPDAEYPAYEQVGEQQDTGNAHAGQRQGNQGVLPAQRYQHISRPEKRLYGSLRPHGRRQPHLVQRPGKGQHQKDQHQGNAQAVASGKIPEAASIFFPYRIRSFPVHQRKASVV